LETKAQKYLLNDNKKMTCGVSDYYRLLKVLLIKRKSLNNTVNGTNQGNMREETRSKEKPNENPQKRLRIV